MNDKIIESIETIRKGYALDPNRILADYRKETAEIRGYHGRELLELLQNAVDELGGTDNRAVSIVLKGDVLTISNNGNAFTYEGFISLMYSNLSPKHKKSEYIGNKGTGFRSILNWADCIRIYSGDLTIEFSEAHAQETLTELLKVTEVADFCQKHNDVRLATLVAPRLIKPLINQKYDTVIEVELKANVIDGVISQLQEINAKTLLFLEKLEKLTIEFQGDVFVYEKTSSEKQSRIYGLQIISNKNSEIIENDSWFLLSRDGDFQKQKYSVIVAYKEDMSVEPDVLYSYFKTKVHFPIHALVHATFDLTADRNHLNETESNKHILKIICDTLVEFAQLTTSNSVNYAPLVLLSTIGSFPTDLSWGDFIFENYYLEAVAASKIFPTVDDRYISFDEMPRFYDSNIADYLSGNSFRTLMPPTDNSDIRKMFAKIVRHRKTSLRFSYGEITEGINTVLPELSIVERGGLWLAFIKEYKNEISADYKPNFVLDSNGNTVSADQQVFLPAENVVFPSPPDFTSIVFMNKDLVSALRDVQGKEGTLRSLANELARFNVREYNLANIINTVISRLKSRTHQACKKTRGCYEDTIAWLWSLWNANVLKNEMPALTVIPLLTCSDTVQNANKLYFGQAFGNSITSNLLAGMDDLFVALPQKIHLTELTKPIYIEFLSALGVAQFPRKIKLQINPVSGEYKELIYTSIKKYPLIAENNYYHSEQELRNAYLGNAEVATVEHLDKILKNANTKSIILWIKQDANLRQLLSAYEPSSSRAYIYNPYQQNGRVIAGEQLASYIRFVFATSKWIEINDSRYSPTQCLLVNKIGTLFAPIVAAPNLDLFIDNRNRKIAETNAVQNILEQVGAASDFSDLDTDTLYSLLMVLPKIDENGEVSKALYASILKSSGLKKFEPQNAKRLAFLQDGKVFCKSSKTYVAIQNVYYLTEKTVSREILKGFNLIAIPGRQNQENIKQYFGISPLKIKGSVIGEPIIHPNSTTFEEDFNDFICYAFCSRVDIAKQSEISTLKALKVRLCTCIAADYGSGKVVLAENSYIRGKNCVYIQAPQNGGQLKQLKNSVDFCSAISELFITAIDIQDDTLFGYIRSLYEKEPHNRNALILHDFDDLNILERSRDTLNRTQSEKEMFISACILIAGEYVVESLKTEIDAVNFLNFKSTANAELLIQILRTLQADVEMFNEKSEIRIDLRPFYNENLHRKIDAEKNTYKNGLFAMLKNEPIDKQRTFLNQLCHYNESIFNPQNSISYDWQYDFMQRYGKVISFSTDESADAAWKANRDIFVLNKDMSIVNDMLVDSKIESLLYFDRISELNKAYDSKKAVIDDTQEQETEMLRSVPTASIPIIALNVVAPSGNTVNHSGTSSYAGSRMAGMKRERNISDWGAFAEKLVYEQMKSRYQDVLWVSENAKKEGINPDGIGGLGYDLRYSNENGETIYVEIKSTVGTGISFVITENELNFAEEHSQQYEITLVTSVMNDGERKIYRLSDLFCYPNGEDRFCNSKFTITSDNYTIRCQIGSTH